ncbi:amidase signature enzyme [Epithele typhae]|uniref:amidase signature enzyme n=1 Tax=Epithele typhae TaxID=378194 RepID=UPI0020081C3D|nr:amidase signature enzyme [Epithele typhae]KAH9925030.1 amidase signature enzyme [Epithele typhae]
MKKTTPAEPQVAAHPELDSKMRSRGLSLRLAVASLITFVLALVWVGYGFDVDIAPGLHLNLRVDVDKTSKFPDLYEASITELQDGMEKGLFTSVDLVKAYFARIDEVNLKGPVLRTVIEMNPSALQQAADLDLERKTKGARGPLHGIPILLKDNIATMASEGMNTTAGSFALLGSIVPRDAHVAAKLRAAGAILLGKANLSEWANFRGNVPSGFSGRGGQASSPYVPLGDPCGSSSGSGIGGAIGLAAATLGSETDGSIVCPSNFNNLVGIKPTVGLTSRAGVIPISEHQDTVGPMCRSVTDAAMVLSVIAGRDPRDNFTLAQPPIVPDYTKALDKNALKGARLGVLRQFLANVDPVIVAAFNSSLVTMKKLGATIVDPVDFPSFEELQASNNETIVLNVDFKVDVNSYIAELVEVPTGVENLAGLIQFNTDHANEELIPPFWDDQSQFITSESTTVNQTFFDALAADRDLGATRGIDAALAAHRLDALILPTDVSSTPAAIVGYPIVTVPLGFFPPDTPLAPAEPTREGGPNRPFGLSFLGTAFSEFGLVGMAFAYEQATHTRLAVRAFPAAVPKTQLVDVVGR